MNEVLEVFTMRKMKCLTTHNAGWRGIIAPGESVRGFAETREKVPLCVAIFGSMKTHQTWFWKNNSFSIVAHHDVYISILQTTTAPLGVGLSNVRPTWKLTALVYKFNTRDEEFFVVTIIPISYVCYSGRSLGTETHFICRQFYPSSWKRKRKLFCRSRKNDVRQIRISFYSLLNLNTCVDFECVMKNTSIFVQLYSSIISATEICCFKSLYIIVSVFRGLQWFNVQSAQLPPLIKSSGHNPGVSIRSQVGKICQLFKEPIN